jgi:hypothetical protein
MWLQLRLNDERIDQLFPVFWRLDAAGPAMYAAFNSARRTEVARVRAFERATYCSMLVRRYVRLEPSLYVGIPFQFSIPNECQSIA